MSKIAIVLHSDSEGYYSGEDDNQQVLFTNNIEQAHNFLDTAVSILYAKDQAKLKGIEILDDHFPEITSLQIQTHIIHG